MEEHCPSCAAHKSAPFWQNKLFILSLVYLLVILLGSFFEQFMHFKHELLSYIRTIAWPVILGLLIGGIIDWLVPSEYISSLMAKKRKRTIIYSVLAGTLMSACSHGILAISIQLYKKGASPPSVVAFLLSSPWANLPLTILMFGFFGTKALFLILSAVLIAIITGYVFMFFDKKGWIEKNPNTLSIDPGFSIIKDASARLKKVNVSVKGAMKAARSIFEGSAALANMVLWWILLGMLIASAVAAYLPKDFLNNYMGPTLFGLLVTLILATVIEICSEGSAPLAFEIYRQTGALGNSFVFLMAGVATDYTEIGLIWTNIGWRTAVLMPVVTVPQVILLGYIANILKW